MPFAQLLRTLKSFDILFFLQPKRSDRSDRSFVLAAAHCKWIFVALHFIHLMTRFQLFNCCFCFYFCIGCSFFVFTANWTVYRIWAFVHSFHHQLNKFYKITLINLKIYFWGKLPSSRNFCTLCTHPEFILTEAS